MQTEDILAAARQEKYRGQEYENKAALRGNWLASIVAGIVGFLLLILEYLIRRTVNFGIFALALSGVAPQFLYEGIKTGRILMTVIGIVDSLLVLFFLLGYVVLLVAV